MNEILIKKTESNATICIGKAFEHIQKGEKNVIRFEKGTYYFSRTGAMYREFYPSNNTSGKKAVIFPMLDMDDVVIDGGGSEFVFCDRVFPFVIQNCSNITLKNFIIDFSFRRYCRGVVGKTCDDGFEVKIDKEKYPFYIQNSNIMFECGSDIISTAKKKLFVRDVTSTDVSVAYIFAGDCEARSDNLAAPAMFTDASKTNDGIYFKFRKNSHNVGYKEGDTLLILNDEDRENDVFFAEFSKYLCFENITVYRGAGMGIIGQMCTNIAVNNMKIKPKETRDDLLSITADALHFIHCDGFLNITNCEIYNTLDDALNVHGAYSVCDEVVSDNAVKIRFEHVQQWGIVPYKKGDIVKISDGDTMRETSSAKISDVTYSDDRKDIVLTFYEKIVDKIFPGSFLENPDRMPEVNFVGNKIFECPNIRISSSKKTVLKNNRINLYGGIIVADLLDYWYESGVVEDVAITDNIFDNLQSKCSVTISSQRRDGAEHMHESILIENNKFLLEKHQAISAKSVKMLTADNNMFGYRFEK